MVHRLYRYSLLTYLIIRVEHFKLDKLPKCNALCELCSHPICEHIFKHFLSNFVSRRKIYIETSENVIGNVKVTKNFSSYVGGNWVGSSIGVKLTYLRFHFQHRRFRCTCQRTLERRLQVVLSILSHVIRGLTTRGSNMAGFF